MIDQLTPILSGVFAVTTIIATALLALLLGSLKTLRDNNGDLSERVRILEADKSDLEANKAKLDAENKVLRTVVTGETHLTALAGQLEEHHRESVHHWDATRETLVDIRDLLKEKS